MPFSLQNHLLDSYQRLARKKFNKPWMHVEEWKGILGAIPRESPGPVTVDVPGAGDPTVFPELPRIDLPPIDWQFPTGDPIIPLPFPGYDPIDPLPIPDDNPDFPWPPGEDPTDDPQPPNGTETKFWYRAVFPGKILNQSGGANYNIRITPNGNLTSTAASTSSPTPVTSDIVARLTDPSLAGTVTPNTWVYVFWVAEYNVVEQNIQSQISTQIQVTQEDWLFNAPGEGGGGKVARVTEEISARDGTTPGSGTAVLYEFSEDSGSLSPITETDDQGQPQETEVTVYNMVTSEIKSGEDTFIQVKRIDNTWWIDVEDCGAGFADIVSNE
jgi:hypothetical protein